MRAPAGRAGRHNRAGTLVTILVGAVALTACGADDDERSQEGESRLVPAGTKLGRLDLSATEAGRGRARYVAPPNARGGLVRIRFRNDGKTPRKAQLWRVGGGHTVADALRVGRRLPPWLTWEGGVGLTPPGRTGIAVQRLDPGRYYVTGNRDERRGVASLTVSGPKGGSPPPAAKARVTALDYGYMVSGLKPGPTAIEFRNAGGEPHHAFFAPLREGRTLAEARRFFAGKLPGPPPVDPEGTRESVVLEGGERQVTRLGLRSGRYALLCVVRDRSGGAPHIDKGMLAEVKVP